MCSFVPGDTGLQAVLQTCLAYVKNLPQPHCYSHASRSNWCFFKVFVFFLWNKFGRQLYSANTHNFFIHEEVRVENPDSTKNTTILVAVVIGLVITQMFLWLSTNAIDSSFYYASIIWSLLQIRPDLVDLVFCRHDLCLPLRVSISLHNNYYLLYFITPVFLRTYSYRKMQHSFCVLRLHFFTYRDKY